MGKHTKEPWQLILPLPESPENECDPDYSTIAIRMGTRLENDGIYETAHEIVLSDCNAPGENPEMEANAERIVECVNACAGLSKVGDVKELVEALILILPLAKGYVYNHHFGSNEKYIETAEQALSKFEVEL